MAAAVVELDALPNAVGARAQDEHLRAKRWDRHSMPSGGSSPEVYLCSSCSLHQLVESLRQAIDSGACQEVSSEAHRAAGCTGAAQHSSHQNFQ